MARQKWCSACINSFVSAEICKLILRSRQYLFFPVWCRTVVQFLTIIFVWLFLSGSSETMLSLHNFLRVLCLDSRQCLFFHVSCRIQYLYNLHTWIAAIQSREKSNLWRYLHLTKACRDITTKIHPHYENMYLAGICQMTALYLELSNAQLAVKIEFC